MGLGEFIKQYCFDTGISNQAFAARCGLSKGYISMLINGVNPKTGRPIIPGVQTYDRIANAMNMSVNELFAQIDDVKVSLSKTEKIESINIDELDEDEIRLISALNALNPANRRILLAVAQAILQEQETQPDPQG